MLVSETKILEGSLSYMGMAAILVNKFSFAHPLGLHMKFGWIWPSGFIEDV